MSASPASTEVASERVAGVEPAATRERAQQHVHVRAVSLAARIASARTWLTIWLCCTPSTGPPPPPPSAASRSAEGIAMPGAAREALGDDLLVRRGGGRLK